MDEKTTDARIDTMPARAPGQANPITLRRAIAVTAAASLLIGIIVGPIIANHPTSAADTTTGTPEHTVTVSGTGTVSATPDVADVMLGITVTKPTAKEARDAAGTAMAAVLAAVKKDGVADKDITTVNVSLNPQYDYSAGGSVPRLTGYQFSNTVKVTVRDLTKVAAIVDDSVTAGATNVAGIAFRVNDPTTIQAQARQLAMTNAHTDAAALAQAAGVSIKGVASISEVSSSPITYYPSFAAAGVAKDSVSTPVQTGTTDVTVQVTVSYLIG
jgi:uncharacterized protein